jgi:hypothetical protein
MNKFFSKFNNLLFVYFIYLLLIGLSSFIFLNYFIIDFNIVNNDNEIILKNISFGHGPLIHNLFYNGEFKQNLDGVDFYLKKTFALPYIIFLLSKISLNIYFVVISKNLILYSIYFFVCVKFLRYSKSSIKKLLILILIPIFIPYNFYVSLNFNFEDCLLAILIPCLYISLVSSKWNYSLLYSSLIIFVTYFVKSSTFLLVMILPFFILLIENKKFKYLPLIFSLLSIIIWGSFGYFKTGVFPVGKTGTSINSKVLSSAMNKDFHKFYPEKSTDLIPVENILKRENFVSTEWEFYKFYDDANKLYLKENLDTYIKDILLKIKFILFNIKKDGLLKSNVDKNPIIISHLVSKIFFNFSLIILLINLINIFKKSLNKKNIQYEKNKQHLYYLIFLILLMPPHLVAWATSKHLIGITSVSILYIYNYYFSLDKNL